MRIEGFIRRSIQEKACEAVQRCTLVGVERSCHVESVPCLIDHYSPVPALYCTMQESPHHVIELLIVQHRYAWFKVLDDPVTKCLERDRCLHQLLSMVIRQDEIMGWGVSTDSSEPVHEVQ